MKITRETNKKEEEELNRVSRGCWREKREEGEERRRGKGGRRERDQEDRHIV